MQLTRGGDYGIQGVLYLAQQPAGQLIPLEAIAEAADLPTPFLAKVLQTLTRAGIVAGRRGAGGGFCLAKPAREITLLAIIEAIEGPLALNRCLRGPGACAQQPICPVYGVWRHAQARLVEVLQSTNMQNLARAARALRRRDTTMPKELTKLESPIDAMHLLHKAFRAEAGRVQKLVDQLQDGDSLQPFQAAFSRWATLLGYHAEMEDTYMTALLPNSQLARDNEAVHRGLAEMLEDTLTSLQEAMLQPGVRARTQRHLYRQVVALRIAQDDHFEEEEEFVLPIIRQRIAEEQQLEMAARLFIDQDAEDQRWILDWVAQDLTPTEQQVLAGLVTRFAKMPA